MIIIKNEETFIFVKWGGGGEKGVPEGPYTYYLVLNKVL